MAFTLLQKTHVEVQLGSTQSALNEKYAEVDKVCVYEPTYIHANVHNRARVYAYAYTHYLKQSSNEL